MIDPRVFLRRLIAFGFIAATVVLATPFEKAPKDVLDRYCNLDFQGKQLHEIDRQHLAMFFTDTATRSPNKIFVVKDFVVSNPLVRDHGADFYVEYVYLGELDPVRARFVSLRPPFPPPPVKVRANFHLVLIENKEAAESQKGGSPAKESTEWKIQGPPPEPHISVDAAMQYMAERRDAAKDEIIKENASRALAALKRLSKGK